MNRPLAQPPLARIDESACIGCTLCIAACPVDAIVGAAQMMHTVLADRCTGCELCLPPCPVDCIALLPRDSPWTLADATRARSHEQARAARLARRTGERSSGTEFPDEQALRSQRQAAVAAALARARARRAARRRSDPRP